MANTAAVQRQGIELSNFWRNALIAIIGAPIITGAAYFVLNALGLMPETVEINGMVQPFSVFPVLFVTLIGAIVATGVFNLLAKRTKNPVRIFIILAVVVLVVMAVPPFLLPNVTPGVIVGLNVLHLVAAGVIVGALTRSAR
jgi:membrane-associated HD superfamily phosphohydrolase